MQSVYDHIKKIRKRTRPVVSFSCLGLVHAYKECTSSDYADTVLIHQYIFLTSLQCTMVSSSITGQKALHRLPDHKDRRYLEDYTLPGALLDHDDGIHVLKVTKVCHDTMRTVGKCMHSSCSHDTVKVCLFTHS